MNSEVWSADRAQVKKTFKRFLRRKIDSDQLVVDLISDFLFQRILRSVKHVFCEEKF